ncbi:MAG: DUF3524 domain-containing protein, partial [Planctomycetota bacterium]
LAPLGNDMPLGFDYQSVSCPHLAQEIVRYAGQPVAFVVADSSAIAADAVWFNSEFNRRTFLEGSRDFLRRMPDGVAAHDLNAVEDKSAVIPPGFEPCQIERPSHQGPLRLGWVGRFEHDKRPDRFCELLEKLSERHFPFELVLLGPRDESHDILNQIRNSFGNQILFDGYAQDRNEYWRWLTRMDVVVSTADHEFFGIAVCEAISAGAIPLTPDGLSYTEYVPDELRYDTLDEAARIVDRLRDDLQRPSVWSHCRQRVSDYEASNVGVQIDKRLSETGE